MPGDVITGEGLADEESVDMNVNEDPPTVALCDTGMTAGRRVINVHVINGLR